MTHKKYCFCTLALGRKYVLLADQLAGDLKKFAPDVPLYILTDDPNSFLSCDNVIAVKHKQRSVMGYNDKLCVVKQCLDLYDSCVFLDADMRILAPVHLNDDLFDPGMKAKRIRTWDYNLKQDTIGERARWKYADIKIMRLLEKRYNLKNDYRELPFVCEFLFSITRNEKIDEFFKLWNEIAEYLEKNRLFIHEGYAIGTSSIITGFSISLSRFDGFDFFEEKIAHKDLSDGLIEWSDEYDLLYDSISRYKDISNEVNLSNINIVDNQIRKLQLLLRYLKVVVFGLHLL